MNFQPIPPELETASEQRHADASFYRGILHELIEMGADLARLVHEQAKSQAEPAADATVAFDRIARTIRRSILLAQKLDQPVTARGEHRQSARRRVIRAVEDAIQRETEDEDAEALHAEFLDRLDGPDLDDDLGDRPVAEIIAEICHDLGLGAAAGTHPWKRRTPADIATLCARAAAGSPAGMSIPVPLQPDGAVGLHSEAGCRGP